MAAPSSKVTQARNWIVPAAWSMLALLAVALLALAVYLLFRMDLFSDTPIGDEQVKSLWAFLGVALGAVATLIGALLTEQNNRRVDARASEASQRERLALKQQKQQARDTEKRLTLDTRAKVLELLTNAEEARIAGAVATMIELRGGPVAMRILGDLWAKDRIGTTAAVWMIDQVLADKRSGPDDKAQAFYLLALHASKLLPTKDDPDQTWNEFPVAVQDGMPPNLTNSAKDAVAMMAIRALMSREPEYWRDRFNIPLHILVAALSDPYVGDFAAEALNTLVEQHFITIIDPATASTLQARIGNPEVAPWVHRLVAELAAWAASEEVSASAIESTTPWVTGEG